MILGPFAPGRREMAGMSNHTVNLQDSFLNHVRKDGSEVEMMLVNGTCFKGAVRGFDNFTVILHVGNQQHLIYKHAIAQIVAAKTARPAQTEGAEAEPHTPPRLPRARKKADAAPAREKEKDREKAPAKFNSLDLSHIKLPAPPEKDGAVPQPEVQKPA